jgi:hypothetical protein
MDQSKNAYLPRVNPEFKSKYPPKKTTKSEDLNNRKTFCVHGSKDSILR